MSELPEGVIVYADGAASPNPGPGGYGVVMIRDGQRREFSAGFRKTTNNRMEILGAIAGLRLLNGESGCRRLQVTIYSDSRYVVDMFNGGYAARWKQAAWTRNRGKDPALNPDLWGDLLDLAERHDVRFVWVKGHAENRENARCDELAVAARCGDGLPPDEGYERAQLPVAPVQLSLF